MQIRDALTTRGRIAVTGLGGIGKTQTAAEYAHNHLDEYDLIYWLRGDDATTLSDDFVRLGVEMSWIRADETEWRPRPKRSLLASQSFGDG